MWKRFNKVWTSSSAAGRMILRLSRRSGSITARTRGYPIIWAKFWNAAHCARNREPPKTAFLARSATIRLPFNRLTRAGRAADQRCGPYLYEKEHPFILHGPGFTLDLENCRFEEEEKGVVRVTGDRFLPTEKYFIKLEGARRVAYRTFVVAGIRDPLLIGKLEEVEEYVRNQAREYYREIPESDYRIQFYNYGKNGVLGSKEPESFAGHEVGVMFEVVAKTQELANSICATVRSTFLHYGYEGRKSTAGNLAFPFAPSDIEFGPVYEFSVYHLMEMKNNAFRIEHR